MQRRIECQNLFVCSRLFQFWRLAVSLPDSKQNLRQIPYRQFQKTPKNLIFSKSFKAKTFKNSKVGKVTMVKSFLALSVS